jgi:hypothetical protein
MPAPLSSLPANPHAEPYRVLCVALKSDHWLSATVKTWVDSTGNPEGPLDLPDAPNLLPAVRLIASAGQWEPVATTGDALVVDFPLDVAISVAIVGSRWRELADLCRAITRRLFSQDTAERDEVDDAFQEAGVHDIEVISMDVPTNETGEAVSIATLKIRLQMMIDA